MISLLYHKKEKECISFINDILINDLNNNTKFDFNKPVNLGMSTLLQYSIKQQMYDVIDKLLEITSLNINIQDSMGDTVLITTCENKNMHNVINKLLLKGADVTITNNFKNTALIIASYDGNVDYVSTILKYDTNVNHVNKFGTTPLIASIISENLEIANMLLNCNANPYLIVKKNMNALEFGKKLGRYNIIDLILNYEPTISVIDHK